MSDHLEGADKKRQPYGVIDIGSNSVRLVIFEHLGRAPGEVFNEKVGCALGAGQLQGHDLDPDGVRLALETLERFAVIASSYGLSAFDVVATAAVRDAAPASRKSFLAAAKTALGIPVRVLSEAEEARFAAEGVVYGTPGATGLVGDLGGGSLELARLDQGTIKEVVSLPLGVQRMDKLCGRDAGRVAELVRSHLQGLPWISRTSGQLFHAVGGNWRNVARVHMELMNEPLRILHAYRMPRAQVQRLAQGVASGDPWSERAVASLKKRRQVHLPQAACALATIADAIETPAVRLSAFGVREGLLFQRLKGEERNRDPLLVSVHHMGTRMGRTMLDPDALERWLAPLFPTQSQTQGDGSEAVIEYGELVRLRRAAGMLADIGWRFQPEWRATETAWLVMRASLPAIDHPGRSFLGAALWYRYAREEPDDQQLRSAINRLGEGRKHHARVLGLALHLAFEVTGGAPDLLGCARLSLEDNGLVLQLDEPCARLVSWDVTKRLRRLAEAMKLAQADVRRAPSASERS